MNAHIKKLMAVIAALIVLRGCGSSPSVSVPDELDLAIRDASDYLNDNIPKGSMLVILNMQSDSVALSDYIIDELIANAVNDRIFKVTDRQQLDLIRTEQNFQLSGEVDDNLALSIGKFFGAQTIVSGKVRLLDERYRMTIRALEVQTAQVQGQYNRNIATGKTITALMRSGGDSGGGIPSTIAQTSGSGSRKTGTTSNGDGIETVDSGKTGKVAVAVSGETGAINVNNVSTWNKAINTIRNGGNNQTYIINIVGNVSVPAPPNNENIFSSVTGITVTIQGGGIISISASGSLLRIAAGQTVVVRNVTLRGRSDNNSPVVIIMSGGLFCIEGGTSVTGNTTSRDGSGVYVDGGTFIMQGGAVSGNTSYSGGGVFVNGGTFTMEGGTISGNTGYSGGGVYVFDAGTYTMQGGTVSGNTCYGGGGGVYVLDGTFTMKSGAILGNNAENGGGVYVSSGTFTKTGGTINGNDVAFGDRNTAQDKGYSMYFNSSPTRWRNATAGPDDNTGGYGFWLND